MTTTQRYRLFGLCLIALVMSVNTSGAYNDIHVPLDDESQEIITRGVLNKQITIVPQLNKLNFGLGKYDGVSFYFKKSLSKIFFQDQTIEATVTAVEFEDMEIALDLFHPVLGGGTLQFVFDRDLLSRVSAENLLRILLTALGDENNRYVFADSESKIFHLYSYLHAKHEGNLIRMTLEEARRQGFHECAFCFKKMLYLPDLAVEMQIEKEWSELLHDYEPLMDGSARQADLSNLGKRVLRNWPLALLGYDYSFQLIKSSRMNAIAIPTGKIVVSTTLLEALENEEEREALLALAIAHIEMRHSLRQYQLQLSASQYSDAMKSLMKTAGSVAGLFPGGNLIGTLGSFTFNISFGTQRSVSGFDEDFEKQADAMAALYFDLYHESRANLSALIQKMQLAQMAERLHPELGDGQQGLDFNDRIKSVENTKFLYFPDGNSFLFKKKNQLPVQLDLIYQSILENESKLFLYINDRSLLADFRKVNGAKTISILVQDKNGSRKFNLLDKFTTEDLWGVQMTFGASGKKNGHFIRDAKSIKLELTRPGKVGDRREEPNVEQFMFVRGKLEY